MAADPVIEAVHLSYGYRRGTPVLDDVHTSVLPGTITAVTGPSGGGKSTLLYLFAGMLNPWSGTILLDGRDMRSDADAVRSRRRAEMFGFVFQDAVLDPRRSILDAVLEPCLYTGRAASEHVPRARALLEGMGVAVRTNSRPGEISGGQAQRVGVCRALLLRPRIVLADEPTGNLDAASADAVMGALAGAAEEGCAVIIATHDDRVVARASRRIEVR